jgi:hypothetical protein
LPRKGPQYGRVASGWGSCHIDLLELVLDSKVVQRRQTASAVLELALALGEPGHNEHQTDCTGDCLGTIAEPFLVVLDQEVLEIWMVEVISIEPAEEPGVDQSFESELLTRFSFQIVRDLEQQEEVKLLDER